MNPRQVVASYLTFQAGGLAAWWCLLLNYPESIKWFQPAAWPQETLQSFLLADAALLFGGSLITAFSVATERPWATLAVWALTVTVWYPTLYCIGVSLRTDQAWFASALMIAMAGLMLAIATIHGHGMQSPAAIRVTPMTKSQAMFWTLVQITVFWSVFLWIMPLGIVELQRLIGWLPFSHRFQGIGSLCLFTVVSLVGLWSGLTMASCGVGTPLPTATAPQLVLTGPYHFVRNPMALTGVLQGVAVGWLRGSFLIITCSVACGFVWHFVVRPVEEADLQERFGESYTRYRNRVGLWWPRFR